MTKSEALRRALYGAAEEISNQIDLGGREWIVLDDNMRPLPSEDIRRMNQAARDVVERLRKQGDRLGRGKS